MVEYCNNMIPLEQHLDLFQAKMKNLSKQQITKEKYHKKSRLKHSPTSIGNKQTKTKVKTSYKTALITNNIIQ